MTQVCANANPDKYTEDDNEDYEEEFETHIGRDHHSAKVQEGIAFMNEVLAKGEPYCDPDFTPNLIPSYTREDEQHAMHSHPDDQWQRVSDLIENHGLFKSGPKFDDVQQGAIGDCYLMAAIAAYAEWPDRIRTTIVNTTRNHCGIYGVIFHINGVAELMIIDDFFLHNDDGHSRFAAFKRGKFWVAVLEKAWAKLLGSYERAWGGNEGDPFNAWTGQPNKLMYHRDLDTDELYDWLERCDKADFAQNAASKPEAANEEEANLGIVYSHGFTIISVHRVELDGQ